MELKKSQPFFTKKMDIFIFIIMLFAIAMSNMAINLLLPFFPIEGDKRGIHGLIIGIIYVASSTVQFFSSPIVGKWIQSLGAKFILLSGCLLMTLSQFGFGLASYLESKSIFAAICLILRGASGLAICVTIVSGSTVLMGLSPHNINAIIGIQEISLMIGGAVGLALGGGLYKIGGFFLPFVVTGIMTLILMAVMFFVLPKDVVKLLKYNDIKILYKEPFSSSINKGAGEKREKEDYLSIKSFISIPGVVVHCSVIFTTTFSLALLDVQLPNHFLDITNGRIKTDKIGLLMFIRPFGYGFGSIILGALADKKVIRADVLILLGSFAHAVLVYFYDPSPLFDIPKSTVAYTAILFMVASLTSSTVAALPIGMIRYHALKNGFPDSIATNGLTAGFFCAAFNFGKVLGYPLAGYLKDTLPFGISCNILSLILLCQTIVIALFCIYDYWSDQTHQKTP